jgi:DNA-binding transcriptional regulator YhcF (GntR family)
MAKYLDIARDLRARIRSGDYPVGSALPGLTELKEIYDASLNTVRGAQTLLREEGVLRIAQGEGAFVVRVPEWTTADLLDTLHTTKTSLDLAIAALERRSEPVARLSRGPVDERAEKNTTNEVRDPFDLGEPLTREQRLERLQARFDQHRDAAGVPVLSEEELLVVVELLGELNAITNPGQFDTDGWGRLAAQMSSRIYSRLGI